MQSSQDAFQERVSKVRSLLDSHDLRAILIRRNPNLAWLVGGRVHVPTTIDLACLDIVVTSESVKAITNVIEAPRLLAEELPDSVEVITIPWWEGRDSRFPTGDGIGSDLPTSGYVDLGAEIEIARSSLTAFDAQRLGSISLDSAKALGYALKKAKSSDREIDVAALVSEALWSLDLEIAFLGIAGAHRASLYRHPLPTPEVVGSRIVASICAKRKGLIASVTRIVSFESWSSPADSDYSRLLEVEREMLDASVVGKPFSDPIRAAVAGYPMHGFASDEWHKHHQGGPTGYLPRDWPANLSTTRLIADQQPIAWNPTANGWKIEDTWLTNSATPVLLSADQNWPTRLVGGRIRPEVLVR